MTALNAALGALLVPLAFLTARRLWGNGAGRWPPPWPRSISPSGITSAARTRRPSSAPSSARPRSSTSPERGRDAPAAGGRRRAALLAAGALGYSSLVVLLGLFGVVLLALFALDARALAGPDRAGLAAALVAGRPDRGRALLFPLRSRPDARARRGVEAEPDLFPGRTFFIFHNESRQSLRLWALGLWIPLAAGAVAAPFALRAAPGWSRPVLLAWLAAWALVMVLKEPFLLPRLLRWAKEDLFLGPLLGLLIAGGLGRHSRSRAAAGGGRGHRSRGGVAAGPRLRLSREHASACDVRPRARAGAERAGSPLARSSSCWPSSRAWRAWPSARAAAARSGTRSRATSSTTRAWAGARSRARACATTAASTRPRWRSTATACATPSARYAAAPGTFRVLALGDSFVEGYTVDMDRPSPRCWKRRCAAGLPGRGAERGTAAYSTDQEYLFYLDQGVRYSPQVVLLFAYYNDVLWNTAVNYFGSPKPLLVPGGSARPEQRPRARAVPRPDAAATAAPAGPQARGRPPTNGRRTASPAARPALSTRWRALGLWEPMGGDEPDDQLRVFKRRQQPMIEAAWERTDAILRALSREAASRGARFALVYVPSRMEVSDRDWELTRLAYDMDDKAWDRRLVARRFAEIGASAGFPVLDLTPDLQRASKGALGEPYFLYDGHWNAAGHRAAAEAVERFLRERGWAPPCAAPL